MSFDLNPTPKLTIHIAHQMMPGAAEIIVPLATGPSLSIDMRPDDAHVLADYLEDVSRKILNGYSNPISITLNTLKG